MKCQSHGLAELARTDTSTSSALTTGISTSASRRTSWGAPYPCWTIALMAYPLAGPPAAWHFTLAATGTDQVSRPGGPLFPPPRVFPPPRADTGQHGYMGPPFR